MAAVELGMPAVIWRDENIPQLVLGTAQLGLPGYGVANKSGGMNQARADEIVRAAWESGCRFFDTAQAYGDSEERLGIALGNLCLGDAGEKIGPHIVTKLAPDLDYSNPDAILSSLEASRSRLGQNRLWGVMLHRYSWLADWDGGLGNALKTFRNRGGAKYLGVSVYEADEALEAIEHPEMDIIQIPTNAWDGRMIRAGVFERTRERDKLLFVRSIFLQGLLLLPPEEAEAKVPGAGRPAEAWARLCRRRNSSGLELAANWAAELHCPLVFGVETPEQVRQIAEALVSFGGRERVQDFSAMREFEREAVITPTLWRK